MYYKLGNTSIEINMPEDMIIPQNMNKFVSKENKSDHKYNINFTDNLKSVVDEFLLSHKIDKEIRRENMLIIISGIIELRIIWIIRTNVPYAVTIEDEYKTFVWVDKWIRNNLTSDTIFGSLLSLEKRVIKNNCLILHSAYILKDNKAILFTAPSGTGKSTQAELWEKYRGARIINGDKALLSYDEKGWYANGWPICGSSEICNNESYPIKAIVVIEQSKDNKVSVLSEIQAFKKLTSEVTINMWNKDFQNKAFDLIGKLIEDVLVYKLNCNISKDAVECLANAMK